MNSNNGAGTTVTCTDNSHAGISSIGLIAVIRVADSCFYSSPHQHRMRPRHPLSKLPLHPGKFPFFNPAERGGRRVVRRVVRRDDPTRFSSAAQVELCLDFLRT